MHKVIVKLRADTKEKGLPKLALKSTALPIIIVVFFLSVSSLLGSEYFEKPRPDFGFNGSKTQNPAVLPCINQASFLFNYTQPYLNITSRLYDMTAYYNHLFGKSGISADMELQSNPKVDNYHFILSYGRRLFKPTSIKKEVEDYGIFLGSKFNLYFKNYKKGNFALDEVDPLFEQKGYSKSALSFGLGIFYRQKWGNISLQVNNINQPEISLGDEFSDKAALNSKLSFSASPISHLKGIVSLSLQDQDPPRKFDFNFGAYTDYFTDKVILGLSADRNKFSSSFNYLLSLEEGIEVRYKFNFPYNGLGTGHKLTLVYNLSPPPPIYPDLFTSNSLHIVKGKPVTDDSLTLSYSIKNKGKRPAKNFYSVVFKGDSLLHRKQMRKLASGEKYSPEFTWSSENAGLNNFTIRVDDKGTKYPSVNGSVLESNEKNNIHQDEIEIFKEPSIKLKCNRDTLKLTQSTSLVKNEPVVPIIFFKKRSAKIGENYTKILKVIGKRMKQNPAAILQVFGYWAPEGDSVVDSLYGRNLALKRSKAVKNFLSERHPSLRERINIIREGYNRSKKRAKKEKFQGTRLGKKYVNQENRRAELKIKTSNEPETIEFSSSLSIPELDGKMFRKKLENNPLFDLIISINSDSTNDSPLFVAKKAKQNITSQKEIEEERVFLRTHSQKESNKFGRIYLSAQKIVYMPIVRKHKEEDFHIDEKYDRVTFKANYSTEVAVKNFNLKISSEEGGLVKEYNYNQSPPSTIQWDWRNKGGQLVQPERSYSARAILLDTLGQKDTSRSKELTIEITNEEKFDERLNLLQFVFGGKASESDYNESRLEYIARKAKDKIESQEISEVVVEGHTDIIGVESHNYELSNIRAEAQLQRLKNYVQMLTGFKKDSKFREWYKSKGVTFKAKGYGPEKPYRITRIQEGEHKEILIGKNKTPLGRTINRRVEVQFKQ